MMNVDVRPHNDVKKLFITFAITFLGVHKLVDNIISPPSPKKTTPAEGVKNHKENCVEIEPNNFFCSDNPEHLKIHKKAHFYMKNFGVPQTIEGNPEENKRMKQVQLSMGNYMKRWIVQHEKNEGLKQSCLNRHDKCIFWASIGECVKNPGYMEVECLLACQACERILTAGSHHSPGLSRREL